MDMTTAINLVIPTQASYKSHFPYRSWIYNKIVYATNTNAILKSNITFKGEEPNSTFYIVTRTPSPDQYETYKTFTYPEFDPRTGKTNTVTPRETQAMEYKGMGKNTNEGIRITMAGFPTSHTKISPATDALVNIVFDANVVIDQLYNQGLTTSLNMQNAGILFNLEEPTNKDNNISIYNTTFKKDLTIRAYQKLNHSGKLVEELKGFNYNAGIMIYPNQRRNDEIRTTFNSTFDGKVNIEASSLGSHVNSIGIANWGYSTKEGIHTLQFNGDLNINASSHSEAIGILYLIYPNKDNSHNEKVKDNFDIASPTPVHIKLSAPETSALTFYALNNDSDFVSHSEIIVSAEGVTNTFATAGAYNGNNINLEFDKKVSVVGATKNMNGLDVSTTNNGSVSITFKDKFSLHNYKSLDNLNEENSSSLWLPIKSTGGSDRDIAINLKNGIEARSTIQTIQIQNKKQGKNAINIEGSVESPICLPIEDGQNELPAIVVGGKNSSLKINTNDAAPLDLSIKKADPNKPNLPVYKLMALHQGNIDLHIANHPNKLGVLYAQAVDEGTNNIVVTGDANKDIGASTKAAIMFGAAASKADNHPGINSLTVKDNALVTVLPETADSNSSTIQNVTLEQGGTVSLIDPAKTEAMTVEIKTKSLTIDHLSGTGGHFVLDIDASNNTDNDKLYIGQFDTGTHYLDLNNTASTSDKAENSVLAYVNEHTADSLFKATEGKNTLYYRRYELASRETQQEGYTQEWYLKKATNVSPDEEATPTLQTLKGINSYALYSLSTLNDTLHQRLGLQSEAIDAKNLWIRASYHHGKGQPQDPFKANLERYQVDLNVYKHRGQHYSSFIGLSYDRLLGQVNLPASSTRNHMDMLGLYHTYHNDRGIYLDTIVQYGWNKFKAQTIKDGDNTLDLGARSNHLFNASIEVGKHIDKNLWFFEPQAQLSYSRASNMRTTLVGPEGTFEVNTHSMNYWLARAGLLAGRYFDQNHKSQIYGKINVLHQLQAKTRLHIVGSDDLNMDYGRNYHKTWVRLGLGANYHTDNHTTLYGDIEKSVGASPWSDLQINVGLRHQF